MFRFFSWTWLMLFPALAIAAGGASVQVPTRAISNFRLADYRGKEWSLSEFSEKPIIVIAVLGTECPLVQKYLPRLEQMSQDYADQGVAFLGINANRQDSLAKIAAQARTVGVTFPLLKDARQTVIDELQATRTPEVFVLDAERKVRYRGRIDDQHAVGAHSRKTPTRHDLKLALDELLAGKPVSESRTEAVGCLITRAAAPKADAAVTYSNQVSRILLQHCVECHRPGEIAPFSLTDYDEVAGWADMIVEVTADQRMPPWHASPEHGQFRNERRLSDLERRQLREWAAAGAPQGNPKDLPAPRTFTAGWQLPREPDLVVNIHEKPFSVPAEGVVRYQHFKVDPKLAEDKWIEAAEIIPGNPSVVHHVICYVIPDGQSFDGDRGFLTAFVPGLRPTPFPKGYARRLPAGSTFIFQVHYTPTGTAQDDLSKMGLVFTDGSQVTHEVITEHIINTRFEIKPNEDDQRFEARPLTMPMDVEVLTLMPHMHLRGKSFEIELTKPGTEKEVLLDVPHYDFNWQTNYVPMKPLSLPRGSVLSGWASYDNSTHNLANPDPQQTVRWGEQTWDEMLLAYFDIAIPNTEEARRAAKLFELPKLQEQASRLAKRFDKNQDGKVERDEIPEAQRLIFDQIDTDKDGVLSMDEMVAGLGTFRKVLGR